MKYDTTIIAQLKSDLAHVGYGAQWHVISLYIIEQALGANWSAKYCDMNTLRLAPFHQALTSEVGAADFHLNVVRLGHMLFQLRDVSGYEDLLVDQRNRDFEPVFFELHAASLLLQSGCQISFVKPTGVKGRDYDLLISIDGIPAAVEVKCRRRGVVTNGRTLMNALKRAKDQLPTDLPGIICIAIGTEYRSALGSVHAEQEIENTLDAFLSSTGRVNKILVFWHRFENTPLHVRTIVKEWKNELARNQLPTRWLVPEVNSLSPCKELQHGFPSFMQRDYRPESPHARS